MDKHSDPCMHFLRSIFAGRSIFTTTARPTAACTCSSPPASSPSPALSTFPSPPRSCLRPCLRLPASPLQLFLSQNDGGDLARAVLTIRVPKHYRDQGHLQHSRTLGLIRTAGGRSSLFAAVGAALKTRQPPSPPLGAPPAPCRPAAGSTSAAASATSALPTSPVSRRRPAAAVAAVICRPLRSNDFGFAAVIGSGLRPP